MRSIESALIGCATKHHLALIIFKVLRLKKFFKLKSVDFQRNKIIDCI